MTPTPLKACQMGITHERCKNPSQCAVALAGWVQLFRWTAHAATRLTSYALVEVASRLNFNRSDFIALASTHWQDPLNRNRAIEPARLGTRGQLSSAPYRRMPGSAIVRPGTRDTACGIHTATHHPPIHIATRRRFCGSACRSQEDPCA